MHCEHVCKQTNWDLALFSHLGKRFGQTDFFVFEVNLIPNIKNKKLVKPTITNEVQVLNKNSQWSSLWLLKKKKKKPTCVL